MPDFKLLATATLLSVAVATVAQAQLCPDSLTMRFRVGLQTAGNRYEVYYRKPTSSPNTIRLQPILVSVGYALTPRVEVQLGYSYWRQHYPSLGSTEIIGTGERIDRSTEYWNNAAGLLTLARYRLTKSGQKKVQFDALLGTTVLSAHYRYVSEQRINGVLKEQFERKDQAVQGYATVGLGTRVLFGRHWAAVWDITLNRNFRSASSYMHQQLTGNRWGLTRAVNLGVHYRFNAHLRKKKAIK